MRFEAMVLIKDRDGQLRKTHPFSVDLARSAERVTEPLSDDETATLLAAFEQQGEIGQLVEVQAAARENSRSVGFAIRLDRSVE